MIINLKSNIKSNVIEKKISNNNELFNFLEDSYNTYKTIKGFELLIKENAKLENSNYIIDKKYLIDHKSYCNLFNVYNSEDEILYYVQDTCEARGETIPKDFSKATNYLINENTIIWEIIEFKIEKNIFDNFIEEHKLKK